MSKNITAASKVIPFNFETREVRTLLIDDQPWFFAVDVCVSLALSDTNKALVGLDEDEKREHEQYSGSGRKPILINESGLYSLILRSRKAEAKRFKKWVTAEVLPAIRKHGRYIDESGQMDSLVGSMIGTSGVLVLDRVIEQKASPIPQGMRRSFKHTMKSRLRSRFNVQRADLIPSEQLADACNFIAAYALEGEWLPKAEQKCGTVLDDHQLYHVYFVSHHFECLYKIFKRYNLHEHLTGLGSRAGTEMIDHFKDGYTGVHRLKKLAPEFDAAQRRLGLNQYSAWSNASR